MQKQYFCLTCKCENTKKNSNEIYFHGCVTECVTIYLRKSHYKNTLQLKEMIGMCDLLKQSIVFRACLAFFMSKSQNAAYFYILCVISANSFCLCFKIIPIRMKIFVV